MNDVKKYGVKKVIPNAVFKYMEGGDSDVEVGVAASEEVLRYMEEHSGVDYRTAMRLIYQEQKTRLYGSPQLTKKYSAAQVRDAGRELHNCAVAWMEGHAAKGIKLTYSQALRAVIANNPILGETYVGRRIK